MNTFDPKAEADALLASLAAAGNGEEMAVSVRKAAWAAAKAAPIELISRAAKEPTVHQYKEDISSTNQESIATKDSQTVRSSFSSASCVKTPKMPSWPWLRLTCIEG